MNDMWYLIHCRKSLCDSKTFILRLFASKALSKNSYRTFILMDENVLLSKSLPISSTILILYTYHPFNLLSRLYTQYTCTCKPHITPISYPSHIPPLSRHVRAQPAVPARAAGRGRRWRGAQVYRHRGGDAEEPAGPAATRPRLPHHRLLNLSRTQPDTISSSWWW